MALEIYYNFVLTLALILIAARLGGEIMERYFGQPPVLGELIAGIAVSPFAIGGLLFHGDPILLNFGGIASSLARRYRAELLIRSPSAFRKLSV